MTKILLPLILLTCGVSLWLFERDQPASSVDSKYRTEASHFLTLTSQARLHFQDHGPDGALPIVLLHGSNASLFDWAPWVNELSHKYRLITIDLPGHGLTGQVPDGDYSTAAYIRVVHELTRHLGLQRFVLGGNSMGGGITWQYAAEYPNRVSAMLLIDASGPQAWRHTRQRSAADSPLAFRLLGYAWFRALARYLDPEYLVTQGLTSSFADPALIDDTLITRYYDLAMRAGSRGATITRFAITEPAVPPTVLETLNMPALVLWGQQDSLIPVTVGARFAETLPNARLIVYDHAGHLPMIEQPRDTARDVDQFLSSL